MTTQGSGRQPVRPLIRDRRGASGRVGRLMAVKLTAGRLTPRFLCAAAVGPARFCQPKDAVGTSSDHIVEAVRNSSTCRETAGQTWSW